MLNETNHALDSSMVKDPIETKVASLSKTGRILEVLFSVIAVAFIVIAVVSAALIVVGAVFNGGGSDDSQGVSIDSAFSVLVFLCYGAIFFLAALVFKDVSNGQSPFTQKQARRIRIISWILFVYAILDTVIPKGIVVSGGVDGRGLSVIRFDPSYIIVNVEMFAAAVIFYFLSSVFKYGVALQELSDDTV